jgi:GTP 3',8-cyclase
MSTGTGNAAAALDAFARPLGSLRISVTDRCNLRCRYCMPEEEYVWLERDEILTFEEIGRLAGVFMSLGVERLRLTGGEPLLRRDLPRLVAMLKAAGVHSQRPAPDTAEPIAGAPAASLLRDLALTTNGLLLAAQARALRDAGLDRVTVSLDTLRAERFRELSRRGALEQVLAGLEAARQAGFSSLKINSVIIRGFNDDELVDLVEAGRRFGAEVRFIEYMDVGGATRWSVDEVVSCREIVERLASHYGPVQPFGRPPGSAAPADRFALPDGVTFGVIASTTEPFCAHCDRARLTPDGLFLLCLYARRGLDLKAALRRGDRGERLRELIVEAWRSRRDRGAEERKALHERGPLVSVEALRRDPHLEMHTRGG